MATNEDADDGQTEEILRVMREEILKFEEDLIPTVNQWTRDYYKAYEILEKDLIATRRLMQLLQAKISVAESTAATSASSQQTSSSAMGRSDMQDWLKELTSAESMFLERKRMYEEEIWPLVQPLDNRLSSKCTLKNLRLMLQAKPEEFQQLWDSFPSSYDRYPDPSLDSLKARHLALKSGTPSSMTTQSTFSCSTSEFSLQDDPTRNTALVLGGNNPLVGAVGYIEDMGVSQGSTSHPQTTVFHQSSFPPVELGNATFNPPSSRQQTTSHEAILRYTHSLFTTQSMTSSFHQHLLNQRGNALNIIQPPAIVSNVSLTSPTISSFSSAGNLEFVDICRPPPQSIVKRQNEPTSVSTDSLITGLGESTNGSSEVTRGRKRGSETAVISLDGLLAGSKGKKDLSGNNETQSLTLESGYATHDFQSSLGTEQSVVSGSPSNHQQPPRPTSCQSTQSGVANSESAMSEPVTFKDSDRSAEIEVVAIEDDERMGVEADESSGPIEKATEPINEEIEFIGKQKSHVINNSEKRVVKIHKRTNTEIAIGTSVFAYRRQHRRWMKGQVSDLVSGPAGEDLFRVKYRGAGGTGWDQSFNQSKQIAFSSSSPRSTFFVGLRVLARFNIAVHEGEGSEESLNAVGPARLMPGVIGELPMSSVDPRGNKNRYLVFFDTGEVQYIPHGAIFHLFVDNQNLANVWQEITDREMATFAQIYLHFYPKRPLLQRVNPGKWIRVKDYKRWHKVMIIAVDSNIIKVRYEDGRSEWLFRGSDRIEIVKSYFLKMLKDKPFKKTLESTTDAGVQTANKGQSKEGSGKQSASSSKQGHYSGRRRQMIVLSSSSEDDEIYSIASSAVDQSKVSSSGSRSVLTLSGSEEFASVTSSAQMAFKSSMIGVVPFAKSSSATNSRSKSSTGNSEATEQSRCFGGKKWATEFLPTVSNYSHHTRCSPQCLKKSGTLDPAVLDRTKKCVLEIPLRYGFQRLFLTTKNPEYSSGSKGTKSKSTVVYKTPCGKSLRSIGELGDYLLITKCQLGIDMFSFDPEILNVYDSAEHEFDPMMEDISAGAEKVPVRVVNAIDEGVPMFIGYIPERKPSREVERMINTDPEFLVCCDCVDNCRNKEKCRCSQLTIENTNLGRKNKKTHHSSKKRKSYGYNHRKLTERLEFGMYECNSKCSCNLNTCYNRVVQHGLTVRLELFKTELKGWGVRALDYIPGGTFICNYSGELLTDKSAIMGAKLTGDTYLMNLDFMEQVDEGKVIDETDDDDGYYMEDDEDEHTNSVLETSPEKDATRGQASDNPIQIDDEEVDESGIYSASTASDKRKNSSNQQKQGNLIISETTTDDETDASNRASASDKTDSVLCLNEDQSQSLGEDEAEDDDDQIQRASDDEDIEGILGLDLDKIAASPDANASEENPTSKEASEPEQHVLIRSSGGPTRYRSERSFNEDGTENEIEPSRKVLFQQTSPLVLDAMQYGNIGRFINHSCEPNLFVQNVFVDSHDPRFPYVGFFVGEKCIEPGTELGWDYGYELGSVPGKVIFCHCGAPTCQKRLL